VTILCRRIQEEFGNRWVTEVFHLVKSPNLIIKVRINIGKFLPLTEYLQTLGETKLRHTKSIINTNQVLPGVTDMQSNKSYVYFYKKRLKCLQAPSDNPI
jgi:hypothetical protein